MEFATLKVEKRDSIGRILLDRPEKKNAIDPHMARRARTCSTTSRPTATFARS